MSFFGPIIIILIVSLAIYLAWYNSPSQKGKRGEQYVAKILEQLPSDYIVLNDLVFPTDKGTTQVDHIVLSKFGVFAIETKNYTGEIYGDDDRKEWTQVIVTEVTYRKKWWKTYTYVTKNIFYNPIKQAYGHVYKIKDLLKDYPHLPVIPLVVFAGGADLNKVHTRNRVIYGDQLIPTIAQYRSVYLNENDVSKVNSILQESNIRQNVDNRTHIKNLKRAEDEVRRTIKSGICPKCGGQLVQRKGKYGTFYGCPNYPNCKFTAK